MVKFSLSTAETITADDDVGATGNGTWKELSEVPRSELIDKFCNLGDILLALRINDDDEVLDIQPKLFIDYYIVFIEFIIIMVI